MNDFTREYWQGQQQGRPTPLWAILLAVLLVMLLAGGALYYIMRERPQPPLPPAILGQNHVVLLINDGAASTDSLDVTVSYGRLDSATGAVRQRGIAPVEKLRLANSLTGLSSATWKQGSDAAGDPARVSWKLPAETGEATVWMEYTEEGILRGPISARILVTDKAVSQTPSQPKDPWEQTAPRPNPTYSTPVVSISQPVGHLGRPQSYFKPGTDAAVVIEGANESGLTGMKVFVTPELQKSITLSGEKNHSLTYSFRIPSSDYADSYTIWGRADGPGEQFDKKSVTINIDGQPPVLEAARIAESSPYAVRVKAYDTASGVQLVEIEALADGHVVQQIKIDDRSGIVEETIKIDTEGRAGATLQVRARAVDHLGNATGWIASEPYTVPQPAKQPSNPPVTHPTEPQPEPEPEPEPDPVTPGGVKGAEAIILRSPSNPSAVLDLKGVKTQKLLVRVISETQVDRVRIDFERSDGKKPDKVLWMTESRQDGPGYWEFKIERPWLEETFGKTGLFNSKYEFTIKIRPYNAESDFYLGIETAKITISY